LSLIAPLKAQSTPPEVIGPSQLNLVPVPASVQIQTGRLPGTSSFNVAVKNYADDLRLNKKTVNGKVNFWSA